jgi:hypothetical protein
VCLTGGRRLEYNIQTGRFQDMYVYAHHRVQLAEVLTYGREALATYYTKLPAAHQMEENMTCSKQQIQTNFVHTYDLSVPD